MTPDVTPDWRALVQTAWADPVTLQRGVIGLLLLLAGALLLWTLARSGRQRAAADALRLRAECDRQGARIAALEPEAAEARDLALRVSRHEVLLAEREREVAALGADRDGLSDALHGAREGAARLDRELAEVRLAASKDRESAARELAALRELRDEMSATFKLMAQDSLRVQGADMARLQSDQMTALLTPFRDQVHRFQTELQARNKVLDEEGARLRQQIEGLHQRSEAISREAVELTRALKGEKQRQGAWGEMILERILEDSGLEEGRHYRRQSGFTDASGARWRPDVTVQMPRGKLLVIDSKVSLVDYERSVNSEDAAERAAALRRHGQAIRNHVTSLAARGYEDIDANSVDYVLMFIPVEGAFSEALRLDPALASFAMERRVGLTTPTTLMLTLRTVEHIWMVEKRETNAVEIAARAGQLYDKVAGFVEAMDGVGRALDSAAQAHRTAVDRLSRGPGNVIRQVEMLRDLGARAKKRIAMDHDGAGALPAPDDAGGEE